MARHNDGEGGSSDRRPCAACKHQRRKCKQDCILSACFPSDKAEEYEAVHKIFGFSNMSKMVKNLESEHDRREAVHSFKWEALMWELHPIGGPFAEYKRLQQECKQLQEECEILKTQLNPPRVSLSEPILMGKIQALVVNNSGAPTKPNYNGNNGAPTLPTYNGYNGSLPLPSNGAPTINNNWALTVPNNGHNGVLSVPNNGYNWVQSLPNNGNNGALGVPINNWHSSNSSNSIENLESKSYVNKVNGPFGQEKVATNNGLERLLHSGSLLPYMPRHQDQRQRSFALQANGPSSNSNFALYNSNYNNEINGHSGFEGNVENSYSNNRYWQEQRGREGQAQQSHRMVIQGDNGFVAATR